MKGVLVQVPENVDLENIQACCDCLWCTLQIKLLTAAVNCIPQLLQDPIRVQNPIRVPGPSCMDDFQVVRPNEMAKERRNGCLTTSHLTLVSHGCWYQVRLSWLWKCMNTSFWKGTAPTSGCETSPGTQYNQPWYSCGKPEAVGEKKSFVLLLEANKATHLNFGRREKLFELGLSVLHLAGSAPTWSASSGGRCSGTAAPSYLCYGGPAGFLLSLMPCNIHVYLKDYASTHSKSLSTQ